MSDNQRTSPDHGPGPAPVPEDNPAPNPSPASSPHPALEIAVKTDPGRDPEKQVNEDAAGYRETRFGHLCVVCDGMGGHAGGREASRLALATMFEHFDQAPPTAAPADVLRNAIVLANQRVHAMVPVNAPEGRPGSTVVAFLVHANGTEIAHVGDSRCYLVHEAQVFQVTKDHSMVQRLVDAQMLTPAQAAAHPDANKILRALGTSADVDVELRPQPLRHVAGDVLLACSDGLSDLVEPEDILRLASAGSVAQAAGQLVNLANARGGHDNITALLARVQASARTQTTKIAPTIADTGPSPHEGGTARIPAIPAIPAMRVSPRDSAGTSSAASGRPGLSKLHVAGIALALLGLAIAMTALYLLQQERAGEKHTPRAFDLDAVVGSPTPSASAVELSPTPAAGNGPDEPGAAPAPLPSLTPTRPLAPPGSARSGHPHQSPVGRPGR